MGEEREPADEARPGPPGTPSLWSVARRWRWTPHLVVATVALRLVAVVGIQLYRYVDSIEYDTLDFSGRWRRPWTTPLLYAWLPDHWDAPTVVVQALIGAACWSLLALALVARYADRRVRLGVAVATVGLGVTTTVTNWDTAKLSESLSISLTVLLLAAWLELLRRTTWGAAVAVVAVTLPWLFVRQSVLPTAWALAGLAVVLAALALRREGDLRGRAGPLALAALAVVALDATATASYARNREIVNTNLTTVVAYRMVPDPDRLAWFVDRGMPLPASGGTDFTSFDQDPAFRRWVDRDGSGTYGRFLLTHPWYSLTSPLRDLASERASWLNLPPYADDPQIPTASMLAPGEAYGSARPVLPEPVEALLVDPGHTGSILFAGALTVGWTVEDRRRRGRRRRIDQRALVAIGLLALSGLSYWTAWHGATAELSRLGLVPALTVRLALVVQLGLLAERALRRHDRSRAPAYPRPG